MSIFELVRYSSDLLLNINITGEIERRSNQIWAWYEVSGDIEQVNFPAVSESPLRKDELWKATCFEFFIAHPNQPEYWEFNMSPSGDWNVFKMDAYRRVGFREETLIKQMQIQVQKDAMRFQLEANVNLEPIIREDQAIVVGVTSIIKSSNADDSFWALTHPSTQADFHLRESFLIEL